MPFKGGETCSSAFLDITGTGNQLFLSDDAGEVVPIGFSFNHFGDNHTDIAVCSNGYLTFGSDLSDFTNDPIPTGTDPNGDPTTDVDTHNEPLPQRASIAANKVLDGMIKRGDADVINAALWFSDLRNFTQLTESLTPEQVLKMLNDYFEFVSAGFEPK